MFWRKLLWSCPHRIDPPLAAPERPAPAAPRIGPAGFGEPSVPIRHLGALDGGLARCVRQLTRCRSCMVRCCCSGTGQQTDVGSIQLPPRHLVSDRAAAACGSVADTDQTADGVADGFKHAAHFTVATFCNGDLVPAIGSIAATVFDGLNWAGHLPASHRPTIWLFPLAQCTQHSNGVFTFQTKAGCIS